MDFLKEIELNEHKDIYQKFYIKTVNKYNLQQYFVNMCRKYQGSYKEIDFNGDIEKKYINSLINVRIDLVAYALNIFINELFKYNNFDFKIDDINELVIYSYDKKYESQYIYNGKISYGTLLSMPQNPLFSMYQFELYYHSILSSIFFYDDNYECNIIHFIDNIINSIFQCSNVILFKRKDNKKFVGFNTFRLNDSLKTIYDYYINDDKNIENMDDYIIEYNYYSEQDGNSIKYMKLLKFNKDKLIFF